VQNLHQNKFHFLPNFVRSLFYIEFSGLCIFIPC